MQRYRVGDKVLIDHCRGYFEILSYDPVGEDWNRGGAYHLRNEHGSERVMGGDRLHEAVTTRKALVPRPPAEGPKASFLISGVDLLPGEASRPCSFDDSRRWVTGTIVQAGRGEALVVEFGGDHWFISPLRHHPLWEGEWNWPERVRTVFRSYRG